MVARVTLVEIDTVRMGLDEAVERFRSSVAPALHDADGYAGCYVLATPAGKALVMTFWRDAEAADAGVASGFYRAQVARFGVTAFRAPPGRQTYDVLVAEPPVPALAVSEEP
jgi:heme-degrading monooxygenase HmoA